MALVVVDVVGGRRVARKGELLARAGSRERVASLRFPALSGFGLRNRAARQQTAGQK